MRGDRSQEDCEESGGGHMNRPGSRYGHKGDQRLLHVCPLQESLSELQHGFPSR